MCLSALQCTKESRKECTLCALPPFVPSSSLPTSTSRGVLHCRSASVCATDAGLMGCVCWCDVCSLSLPVILLVAVVDLCVPYKPPWWLCCARSQLPAVLGCISTQVCVAAPVAAVCVLGYLLFQPICCKCSPHLSAWDCTPACHVCSKETVVLKSHAHNAGGLTEGAFRGLTCCCWCCTINDGQICWRLMHCRSAGWRLQTAPTVHACMLIQTRVSR